MRPEELLNEDLATLFQGVELRVDAARELSLNFPLADHEIDGVLDKLHEAIAHLKAIRMKAIRVKVNGFYVPHAWPPEKGRSHEDKTR